MILTDAERRFLDSQPRGHLATIGPDGTPQVKPLGFTWNADLETIDITGWNMGGSAKYRNVTSNPRVSFVVDQVTEETMEGAHFLEIRGTAERPRISVFRSNRGIFAQLVDDGSGRTLAGASWMGLKDKSGDKSAQARAVGKALAAAAKAAGIDTVVFDRGGYTYGGRIAALADAARENGLKF